MSTKKSKQNVGPYDSVLMEGLRSDFRAVTEGLAALQTSYGDLKESMEKGFDDVRSEIAELRFSLNRRIDGLELKPTLPVTH